MGAVMDPVEASLLDVQMLDEVKCESRHTAPDNPDCSHSVTFKATNCVETTLLCLRAANAVRRRMFIPKVRCRNCDRPPRDCWSLVQV